MKLIATAAVFASALLILSGCSGAQSDTDIEGTWGGPEGSSKPFLTFAEDGKISGFDGCNTLMGSWERTDSGVDFGQLASTRMACDGVDTWLSNGVEGTISGSTLTVLGEDGSTIGTLKRQDS
ncbi:META domain-containing protein [Lysinibacter cavernae]|uniref:Heat shock protein HslJ n=1 Tax=Lysinibacter cavernae TaxID=1640652 RepID=A0A7X5R3J1_9MICO|nr:META domain-containing protein [Lysinibacter cavernae]NIH54988.1 heat shock protein HslJ [Lysinibacter cavernae]